MPKATLVIDLESDNGEIILAQKLASGDPNVRQRAMRRLKEWLQHRMESGPEFTESDLLKLWKGLYYCLWMQDKPLIQEQLVDDMCALERVLHAKSGSIDTCLLYFDCFLRTIAREWYNIDKWRIDKIMMFVRRMFRVSLSLVGERGWTNQGVTDLLTVLSHTVHSNDIDLPDGFKFHFANIYLDELDLAAKQSATMNNDVTDRLLAPYEQLLTQRSTKQTLFDTILKEIYETILVGYMEELYPNDEEHLSSEGEEEQNANKETKEKEEQSQSESQGLKFDYAAIGKRLMAIGSDSSTLSARRKQLYAIVKKYEAAARGLDPFDENAVLDDGGKAVTKRDIAEAANRMARRQQAFRDDREKFKRDAKKRSIIDQQDQDEDSDLSISDTDQRESIDNNNISDGSEPSLDTTATNDDTVNVGNKAVKRRSKKQRQKRTHKKIKLAQSEESAGPVSTPPPTKKSRKPKRRVKKQKRNAAGSGAATASTVTADS